MKRQAEKQEDEPRSRHDQLPKRGIKPPMAPMRPPTDEPPKPAGGRVPKKTPMLKGIKGGDFIVAFLLWCSKFLYPSEFSCVKGSFYHPSEFSNGKSGGKGINKPIEFSNVG